MDALTCLKTRRSIRAYEDRQVDEALLAQVLEAGMYAPTGMGRQSPKMVVVQDRATRDQLSRMNAAVMNSTGDPFYGAPTVIVVLADPAVGTWRTVIVVLADPAVGTWREDGSLVMGNLMNAAHAVGLGSCWIHRAYEEFQSPEGKALLKKWGVPENYVGVGHCILGYAKGEARPPKERKADYVVRV